MNPELAQLLQQYLQGSTGGQQTPMAQSDQPVDPSTGVTPTPTGTSATPIDLSSLIATDPTLSGLFGSANQLTGDTINGGNTNMMNLSGTTGAYSTAENELQNILGLTTNTGTTNTTGNTTGNTAQTGTTSGLTNTAGTTTGATTGGQSGTTTGTTSSAPVDLLGVGSALQNAIPGATSATNAEQQFLTNAMQQGNPALQQQVGQATSAALSGPGMTGTGNASQARAAGTAASQVGINDFGQQLTAAQELGGPTALSALASAAQPYGIGQVGSTTGTNTGTNYGTSTGTNTGSTSNMGSSTANTASTGTNNQQTGTSSIGTNLQNMTGSTTAGGTAVGSNAGVSAGNAPQSSSSSGGCYVCSALAHHKIIGKRSIRAAVRYKLHKRKDLLMAIGYSVYGPVLAKAVLRSSSVRSIMTPIARAILYEELRLAGRVRRFRLGAAAAHAFFHVTSSGLGLLASTRFTPDTRDVKIRNFLQQEGLLINVYE